MPIARHIFGRDKPSLTCLVHGGAEPVERRRALGLQQVFHPRPGKRRLAHERKPVPANSAVVMSKVWQAVLAVVAILEWTRAADRRSTPS
jgi:hypothetical protein